MGASEYNGITVCRYIVRSIAFLERTHIVNILLLLVGRPVKRLNFLNFQINLLKYDYGIMREKCLTAWLKFFKLTISDLTK